MVRHDDAITAMMHGKQSVFSGSNTLDKDLHFVTTLLLQPLDIPLPVQRRVGRVAVECNRASREHSLPILARVSHRALLPLQLLARVRLDALRYLTALLGLSVRVRVALLSEIRNLKVSGKLELVPDLEVAAAEHGRVDGQEDGFEAGLLGALDQLGAVVAVFEEVQLQHAGVVARCRGDFFERLGRERREAHDDALVRAGSGGALFAVFVG